MNFCPGSKNSINGKTATISVTTVMFQNGQNKYESKIKHETLKGY
jgi:CRISPR/Cas system CMR-associated protein Cmr1 (group 7 of RAMP superfamily)